MNRVGGNCFSRPVALGVLACGLLWATACGHKKPKEQPIAPPPEPSSAPSSSGASADPEIKPVALEDPQAPQAGNQNAAPALPPSNSVKGIGLAQPETALWDMDQDIYFVSNVNGDPSAMDKNGFISKVSPDGTITDLKWIDGSKKKTELNAPKGMAIVGDTLYVADINTVRKFDRKSGKSKGHIAIPHATFLNGIAPAPSGDMLYVSDSGVRMQGESTQKTGTDAIFTIDTKKSKVKTLIRDTSLDQPNGVLADAYGVWVVTLGSNDLYHVDAKGMKSVATKLPKGQLDGIVALTDGSLLISSWEGKAVYRGKPGEEFKELIPDLTSPAGIGLDAKRQRALIPLMTVSELRIQPLPELTPLGMQPSGPVTPPSAVVGQ